MTWKKFVTYGIIMTLMAAALAGCGNGSQKSTSEDTTKIVQVTKVDGTTITADVGELESDKMEKGAENGEMPDGTPPANLDGKNSDGGTPPPMPSDHGDEEGFDGNMSSEKLGKDGEPPSGGPGGSRFTASGEEISFTLSDSTEIIQEFQQGNEEAAAEDIVVNSVLEVTFDSENQATKVVIKNLQAGNGFGGSDVEVNGTSANTIDEDESVEGQTYTSDGEDENALRIDGAKVTLEDITIKKKGGSSSNTENGDFYGQNAGLLVLNGSEATIKGGTFQTNAVNGNAVFSYGEGTTVNISDAKIRTKQDNSGGIQTTGGGTTNATDLDVQTAGNSSAAIRSDRGGGTVNVTGGKYATNGTGSPSVYCTANISVENAQLLANASEGIVVEGKNSVSLKNCNVTGNMRNTYNGDSDENIHCIMIYQSMSGDASVGEADFAAEGGSITSKAGDLFYITNTDCKMSLKDVKLTLANDTFLRIEGNSSSRGWGTEGANGGDAILTTDSQKIEGNILVDSISSLNLSLSNGTQLKGAINPDGEGGTVDVTLSEDSTWILTGDSYITSFDGDTSSIDTNGYQLYVDGEPLK